MLLTLLTNTLISLSSHHPYPSLVHPNPSPHSSSSPSFHLPTIAHANIASSCAHFMINCAINFHGCPKDATFGSLFNGKFTRRLHSWCQSGDNSKGIHRISSKFKDDDEEEDEEEEEEDDDDDGEEGDGEAEDAVVDGESLILLEWPLICAQVAAFARTAMGVAAAKSALLPVAATRRESEELLAQTAAVLSLPSALRFAGITDVAPLLSQALSGRTCSVSDLCALRNTLVSSQRLADQIMQPFLQKEDGSSSQEEQKWFPLRAILADCDLCSELKQELERCIDSNLEIVLDRASVALGNVRDLRRENMKRLEALMKATAARVVEAGGMDSAIVTKRRGRLCAAVKTTHKHLLEGGVVLGVSNTGATVFMEPQAAIDLNNREIVLSVREQDEEAAILRMLTSLVVPKAKDLAKLCECVTHLDLASARAAHAKWLGAVRPAFTALPQNQASSTNSGAAMKDNFLILMESVRHPLLLGSALSKAHQISLNKDIDDEERDASQPKFPVPIDVKVRSHVKGVVLSGPNTGGKTATLKTLGIVVLMSKAGLYIPAKGQPTLPWFTRVLADIGDSQSLQQNLSTFSGHIKQICKIINSADNGSLVLLDELGGGTDPSEGAALATAILTHLVQSVGLTVATTHSMELKDLGIQDAVLENASVEFDTRTLRPTYRVLWGQPGSSNALDIASSFDFDPAVLTRARSLLKELTPDALRARQSQLTIQLLEQLEEEQGRAKAAAAKLLRVQKLHSELASEASNLDLRMKTLKYRNKLSIDHEIAEAELRISEVVSKFEKPQQGESGFAGTFSLHAAEAAVNSILKEYSDKYEEMLHYRDKNSYDSGKSAETVPRLPQIGDIVLAKTLGRKQGVVVESPRGDTDYLTVQIGILKVRLKLSEIIALSP